MAKRNGPSDAELIELHKKFHGNIAEIGRYLNKPQATVGHWYRKQLNLKGSGICGRGAKEKLEEMIESDRPELPEFPDGKVPAEDVLDYLQKHYEKAAELKATKKWFKIKMPDDKPVGLAFVGDPHLGDNGVNYPLLRHHVSLLAETDGMYAVNIGDTANNWTGRLVKLYGEQDSSRSTERQLADWFLNESGIDWLCWLMGNHDMWGEFSEILRGYNIKRIPMEDWQAQFRLMFPNKKQCRIWASHNFKGHSMWNTLHGPQKAAHMKEEAHIYANGHTHNWAIHQEESGSKSPFTYWLVRARGYKYLDEYAELLGHFPQQEGATITAIVNPDAATEAGFVQCYADMDEAAEYLTWLRSR